MNGNPPDDFKPPKGYLRPNDRWICGYACRGEPCELGPSIRGVCQLPGECEPARVGSQWQCGRSSADGGPCAAGPSPMGQCGGARVPCIPAPSWRVTRGRWVRYCLATVICALAVLLSPSRRKDFLAPGPLTQHHAQLLSQNNERRCEACHGEDGSHLAGWLFPASAPSSSLVSQSDRCIQCHENVTSAATGKWAHGFPREGIEAITQHVAEKVGKEVIPRPNPANNRGEIACATCHREHHGTNFNLMAMRDEQCQVCHQQQFASFQKGHPEFQGWPYERRTRIAFDHVTHAYRHFKEKGTPFDCRQCHAVDATGAVSPSPGFDACAKCHTGPINLSAAQGIEILRLPSLDVERLRANGVELENWPESLSSDFDGILPPFMWQLMSELADPEVTQGMQELGADFDFLDVDVEDDEQMRAVVQVISGMQMLLEKLAEPGVIPPEVGAAVHEVWLPQVDKSPGDSSLKRAGSPAQTGWIRDDQFYVLRYVPSGHGDLQMQKLLDHVAAGTEGDITALPTSIAGKTAPGLCRSCHSVEQSTAKSTSLHFQWKGVGGSLPWSFTRFDHEPHLQLPGLSDCTSCHGLDTKGSSEKNYESADPAVHTPQFRPITRESCAACHSPQGAGSDCTQCHQYHIRAPAIGSPSWALETAGASAAAATPF
jgi:hypothetical protein